MSKVIDISLNPSSINKAIKALNKYRRELNATCNKVVKETAEFAKDVALAYYSGYEGDDPNVRVEVTPYSNNKGYHVIATADPATITNAAGQTEYVGNQIMFAEFGAGVLTEENNDLARRLNVTQGSFSSTVGTGEFSRKGYWHHGYDENGDPIVYYGIGGTNAMYNASQDAKKELQRLAERYLQE